MSAGLDSRLLGLQGELDEHARVARYLGLDLARPVRSLADGYPENAIALVGKITERLLKQLWIHHGAPGTPDGKALADLISGCRPYIRSHRVIGALHEIQRLRNRSAHDGYPVADEDGMLAIRRLLDVLSWYTSTGSGALSQHAPRLSLAAAAKTEFLAGLYLTLDFRLATRKELSQHTAYLLFTRERGLRREHVELLLSSDTNEATRALAAAGGTLLRDGLPRLTRFLVLDAALDGRLPPPLRGDWQVVAYGRFMDVFADCGRHIADVAGLYPPLDAPAVPIKGDLLAADAQSGEMEVSSARGRPRAPRASGGGRRELAHHRRPRQRQDNPGQAAGRRTKQRRPAVPVLLRLEPQRPPRVVLRLRHPDSGPVYACRGRVRVPGVLLFHPRGVCAVRPGRVRRSGG